MGDIVTRINTYKFQKQLLGKTKDRKRYMKEEQVENYKYEVRYFPEIQGQRAVLYPLKEKKYEELQQSRGIAPNNTNTRKDLLSKIKKEINDVKKDDLERLEEITNRINVKQDINKVVEIGFRIPRVLEIYQQLDCETFGYDVVDFNVKIAGDLGYHCDKMDLCDYGNQNLNQLQNADLVVCAVGVPKLIKKEWLKKGAVVIDAGYHPEKCGDIDLDGIEEIASSYTPVPGGVGPMTINTLILNTMEAARKTLS